MAEVPPTVEFPAPPPAEPATPVHEAPISNRLLPTEEQATAVTTPPGTVSQSPPDYGRYILVGDHAQGGLGKVSLARDAKLGRVVALKEIRPDRPNDALQRQRFVNEAAITGQLEHPGVVPVYTLDEDATGKPYYAMRFIQGRTLTQAIEDYQTQPTPLGFRNLLQRFISICQTMAYAHSKGVLHRDLKPDNVMLGDYGETLVVDWGLAKQLPTDACRSTSAETDPTGNRPSARAHQQVETQEGQIMGTPAYMSPEQARGEAATLGPATDIYALGAILYTILTGLPPFAGNVFEILDRVRQGNDPPSALAVNKGVPRALAAVCAQAMALQPSARYASAAALAQDVERWLADEPTTAYAEPFLVRWRRWRRRHRSLVAGTMAAVTVLAVMLGLLVYFSHVANQRENQLRLGAEKARDRTRHTIEQMTSEQALAFLSRQPELLPEQRAFLKMALTYYQELATEAASTQAERARQALAYRRMCIIQLDIGQKEDALAAAMSAVTLSAQLVAECPNDAGYCTELAQDRLNLGWVLAEMGRHTEAERAYRDALALHLDLEHRFPAVPEHRQRQGTTQNLLGSLLSTIGRWEEAETAYRHALAIYRKLATDMPHQVAYRRGMADSNYNLAVLLPQLGRRAEAEACIRLAMPTYQELVDATPADPILRLGLANIRQNHGSLLSSAGRRAEAERNYRAALELFQQLTTEFPSVPLYAARVASCHGFLATLLESTGRRPEAAVHVRKAMEVYGKLDADFPSQPKYRSAVADSHNDFADVLDNLGRREEAVKHHRHALAMYQKLVADYPTVPAYRRQVAYTYQVLAFVLEKQDRKIEAEGAYRQGLALRRQLAQAYPALPSYRESVATSLSALGFFLNMRQGRNAEALELFTEAEVLIAALVQADPHKPLYHRRLGILLVNRARVLAHLGRFKESAEVAAQAAKAHSAALLLDPQGTSSYFHDEWQKFAGSGATPGKPPERREKPHSDRPD